VVVRTGEVMALPPKQKQILAIRFSIGVAGLVAVIIGLILNSHNSNLASLCNSGPGGHPFNPVFLPECRHANNMVHVGLSLAVIGFIALVYGTLSTRAVFNRRIRPSRNNLI
jgi:hypothetical protein